MKIDLRIYGHDGIYGFSHEIRFNKWVSFGNACPKWSRPIAKFLRNLGIRTIINLNR